LASLPTAGLRGLPCSSTSSSLELGVGDPSDVAENVRRELAVGVRAHRARLEPPRRDTRRGARPDRSQASSGHPRPITATKSFGPYRTSLKSVSIVVTLVGKARAVSTPASSLELGLRVTTSLSVSVFSGRRRRGRRLRAMLLVDPDHPHDLVVDDAPCRCGRGCGPAGPRSCLRSDVERPRRLDQLRRCGSPGGSTAGANSVAKSDMHTIADDRQAERRTVLGASGTMEDALIEGTRVTPRHYGSRGHPQSLPLGARFVTAGRRRAP
jgi:hypothetical protein